MPSVYRRRFWGITDDEYDKFYQSFRKKVAEIDTLLSMLQEAEDNYYLSAKYLLELANLAYNLFKRSEVAEIRQILKLVLQNLTVEDKKVRYTAQKPFDTILDCADRQLWLPLKDLFCNRKIEFDVSLDQLKFFSSDFGQKLAPVILNP